MSHESRSCELCGSPVVIAAGDEGTNHYVPANRPEHTAALLEVERLRNIIGELYVARGGSRADLYLAIKRAFRASTDG